MILKIKWDITLSESFMFSSYEKNLSHKNEELFSRVMQNYK